MSKDTPSTRRSADDAVEFYVPATFQFSVEPGRIERILVGLFPERGGLEARIVTGEPTEEFYTPAMYQFSTEPGRLERFLETVFTDRSEQKFKPVPDSFVDMFYLPATDPDAFRHRGDRPHAPVVPAADVLPEQDSPPSK